MSRGSKRSCQEIVAALLNGSYEYDANDDPNIVFDAIHLWQKERIKEIKRIFQAQCNFVPSFTNDGFIDFEDTTERFFTFCKNLPPAKLSEDELKRLLDKYCAPSCCRCQNAQVLCKCEKFEPIVQVKWNDDDEEPEIHTDDGSVPVTVDDSNPPKVSPSSVLPPAPRRRRRTPISQPPPTSQAPPTPQSPPKPQQRPTPQPISTKLSPSTLQTLQVPQTTSMLQTLSISQASPTPLLHGYVNINIDIPGQNVQIGENAQIGENVQIGQNVQIGENIGDVNQYVASNEEDYDRRA